MDDFGNNLFFYHDRISWVALAYYLNEGLTEWYE